MGISPSSPPRSGPRLCARTSFNRRRDIENRGDTSKKENGELLRLAAERFDVVIATDRRISRT